MDYQQQVTNVGTSSAPSLARGSGQIWLAWKGEGSDKGIYWSTSSSLLPDSSTGAYAFKPQAQLGVAGTSAGPAIAFCKGAAYLAWKGESDSSILWSKCSDGKTWSAEQVMSSPKGTPAPGTSDAPALASDGSSVYMAWKGDSDSSIWWSKCTDGKTWSAQQALSSPKGTPAPGTSATPALASDGSSIYMAWKGESDSWIWWSKSTNGKTWSTQQRGPAGSVAGPALVVDGNQVVWLAWNTPSSVAQILQGVAFSSLVDEAKNQWSRQTFRYDAFTTNAPALLSAGTDSSGLVLAWSGLEPQDQGIYYGLLRLPAQEIIFNIPSFHISNMRTGHAGFKDGSDTDYVSLGVKIEGQPATVVTKSMGDQTGGDVSVGLGTTMKVQDTDTVIFHYAIINSSAAASAATSFLESAGSQLLTAVENADVKAVEEELGLPLVALSPQEAGALIGAQLGAYILPGFGAVLGAIAGWFVDSVGGFVFPDCDGPVAVGLYAFSATALRYLTQNGAYIETDENPGVNSASGCGSNSDYQVTWNCASASNFSSNAAVQPLTTVATAATAVKA